MNVPSIKRRWRSYSSRNKASYIPTPNHLDTGVSGAISGLGNAQECFVCERKHCYRHSYYQFSLPTYTD